MKWFWAVIDDLCLEKPLVARLKEQAFHPAVMETSYQIIFDTNLVCCVE